MGNHAMRRSRLIIITGPSCAGKTPLWKALKHRYPQIANRAETLVVYNDRTPRPGEKDGEDYHFRDRATIRGFQGEDRFVVTAVRKDLQAIDIRDVERLLASKDVVYEGNPRMADLLLDHPQLRDTPRLSIFISPLAADEVAEIAEGGTAKLREAVTTLMRRRLMRRASIKHDILTLPILEDIETRATHAYQELSMAHRFDHVVVNHDGEDSDHWNQLGVVLGSARRAVHHVASLLQGRPAQDTGIEAWTAATVPHEAPDKPDQTFRSS